jgi:hypothetical protein
LASSHSREALLLRPASSVRICLTSLSSSLRSFQ